jgi:hypothetical protein
MVFLSHFVNDGIFVSTAPAATSATFLPPTVTLFATPDGQIKRQL